MTLNLLYFLSCILTISGCCAWVFGARVSRFDLASVLIGLALAPTITAIILYVGFATLTYLAPSRPVFVLLPVVVAAALAFCFGKRRTRNIRWSEIIQAFIYGSIFFLVAYPALLLLLARAGQHEVPHDLTTYFLQAIDINTMMRSGTRSIVEWWSYKHPSVSQPHSLSFPIFLAWGFLFVDAPGYGADYFPKLLVAWTIVSLVISCVSVAAIFGLPWGFAAGVVVLANNGLVLQMRGLSRDSFYLAPYFVLAVLLTMAKPREIKSQIPILLGQSAAVIATLAGHTLGIVYSSGLFAAYGLAAAFRFRRKVFYIPSIWLIGGILTIGFVATYIHYFYSDAASIGFEFPYYVDPFQASLLKTVAPFAVDSNITDLLSSVISKNGIDPHWLLLVAAAAPVVVLRFYRTPDNELDVLWLTLALSILICLLAVSFAPIRLEGLSLASAFVVNFRYGFGLSLTIQLLIVCSMATLTKAFLNTAKTRFTTPIAGAIAMILAITIHYKSTANWQIYPENENSVSRQRDTACKIATDLNPRRILIDDANMLYICKGNFVNTYSNDGVLVTGAIGDDNISAALEAQEIDAVVFYTAPSRWSGTRLYQYLQKNWRNLYRKPDRAEVYVRP